MKRINHVAVGTSVCLVAICLTSGMNHCTIRLCISLFYKTMSPSTQTKCWLAFIHIVRSCSMSLLQGIPDKFVQHIRGKIAKTVKLESRTGCTFDVEVTESLGKVVLQTGWKAFVCAHDLKMWDFLVFKYNGSPRLKVLIFDLSCCEKVPPCHTRDRGKGEEQIENSRSCDDFPMKSPGSKRKAWKQREGSMNVNTSSTSLSDSSGWVTMLNQLE